MTILHRTFWFITLLVLQVLVFNHIHIMGFATPMPFIYLLLILQNDTPRWVYVAIGFALGICVDIFSNTIGECAAAATLLGLITPHLLNAFAPADKDEEGFLPSARTMKWSRFTAYAFVASLMFCTTFFLAECFSTDHLAIMLIHMASSTLITLLIICITERIRLSVKK